MAMTILCHSSVEWGKVRVFVNYCCFSFFERYSLFPGFDCVVMRKMKESTTKITVIFKEVTTDRQIKMQLLEATKKEQHKTLH